jgi:hypothetical protein
LQADLHLCRYRGVSYFDYGSRSDTCYQVIVKVDNDYISAGKFMCNQSAAAAMVADVLLVAGGGEPVNFPTLELHDQVGCLCYCGRVCGRVCLSHYDGPLDRGSPAYRAMWEQRLDVCSWLIRKMLCWV